MKCDTLVTVLDAHAAWLATVGKHDVAARLGEVRRALGRHGAIAVSKVLAGAEKHLSKRRSDPTNDYAATADALVAAAEFCRVAGSKAAPALVETAQFLKLARPDRADLEYVIGMALQKAISGPEPIDLGLVKRLSDELTTLNSKPEQFAALVKAIATDKRIGKAAANEIANRFLGLSLTRPSKAAAIKKIEERHRLDLLNDSRARVIERIAV
jgi:hypothetical protein